MEKRVLEHYQEILPALKHPNWRATGAVAIGCIIYRYTLSDIVDDEVTASLEVCIRSSLSGFIYLIELRSKFPVWPTYAYSTTLEITTTAPHTEVVSVANAAGQALFDQRRQEITELIEYHKDET